MKVHKYSKKKNNTQNKSKVSLGDSSSHPVQYVYSLMALLGVIDKEENRLQVKYDEGVSHLSIAVPSIKFGIAFPGDKTENLVKRGWHIENISPNDLEAFKRIYNAVNAGKVAKIYSVASPNVKTTSKPEEKIFSEIIRRGLPVPNRNIRINRKDGSELTTPDFTWEKEKVAFFMDGAYWHSVSQDERIIKQIRDGEKTFGKKIVSDREDKVQRDQRIRSDLTVLGWTVLSCTDKEIESQEGVEQQVKNISEVLKRQSDLNKFSNISDEGKEILDKILKD